MTDLLIVDLNPDGTVSVTSQLDSDLPEVVPSFPVAWPLDADVLDELRWYLEDYLILPSAVYGERGAKVQASLRDWGTAVFAAVFGDGPARDAYQRLRFRSSQTRLVFRSPDPRLLALPWELMRDPARPMTPLALDVAGVSRSLPAQQLAETIRVAKGKLRVLMVIARPDGQTDVGYQMIARPLLERLTAVRGQVDLVVLRPPTLDQLGQTLLRAAEEGAPFQVVHFDGHGIQNVRWFSSQERRDVYQGQPGDGVLVFEKPGGGPDEVPASAIAQVLAGAKVPVVVLNACQSGAIGRELEATVATRLLQHGTASVVAMAYSVYAVAAAEFMAAFYEALFAGKPVSAAVTAGRERMSIRNERPSPKGDMPLEDWLVPVHYLRSDVSFPRAVVSRTAPLSLAEELDQIGQATHETGTRDLDPVGTFIGRDWLTCQLETAARLRHVVLLHGPGGTGKTELAKAFGRWWRDTGGVDKPEWVFFHSFEPGVATFGLDAVVNEIGRQLFGTDFDQQDPADRRAVVEKALAERSMLLIWDNFETVRSMPESGPLDDDGCRQLREFLTRLAGRGKSAALITSRSPEPWLGEVRRITVGGLTTSEASQYATILLELYPSAAQRRRKLAFGELMTWLDGHPLSMRLILPHLDTSEPDALLDALRGIVPLPGLSAADGDRLTSLPASIEYSYSHLPDRTRRLLPAVSLFQEFADANILAEFSGVTGVPNRFAGSTAGDWVDALREAIDVGLLTPAGGALCRIHPALPAYLAARWREDNPAGHSTERDAATGALTAAFAALGIRLATELASGDAGFALTTAGLHRRTMGSVLSYALAHGRWEDARAILGPLHSYLEARGLNEEASAWADEVRLATEKPGGAPPEANDSPSMLRLLAIAIQAKQQAVRRQHDQATDAYKQIIASIENEPSSPAQQSRLAAMYHDVGNIAFQREQLGEAEQWYRKELAIGEELGDGSAMAAASHHLGVIAVERGHLDAAATWFHKALAANQERDKESQAAILGALGTLELKRGNLTDAETWYRKSLAISDELGNKPGMVPVYLNLGILAITQNMPEKAEHLYRQALGLQEELDDQPGMARTYQVLGMLAQGRGRLDEAESWYRKSLAIEEETGNTTGIAYSIGQLGLLAEAQGKPELALARMVESVVRSAGLRGSIAETSRLNLVRLARRLGIGALEQTWRTVTGDEVPGAVRDYVEAGGRDG